MAQRRAQAAREVNKLVKKGQTITPVRIEGRAIASTFWGKAWCENLEGYSDFENRLPRGRTYARNGSVVHLAIEKGSIKAIVSGSELYEIEIKIATLPASHWLDLKKRCAGQMGTLVELLQGKLSKQVMEMVTDRDRGLFPKPKEITMRCSCPDSAGMCKHIAAVMYGVGNRLDSSPDLLFALRGVNQKELIEQAIPDAPIPTAGKGRKIASDDLGAIFGIEISDAPAPKAVAKTPAQPAPQRTVKIPVAQPITKIPAKRAAKTTAKPTPKAAAKPVAKAAAKPVAKAAAKSVTKAAAKPITVAEKAVSKTIAKTTAKTAAKPSTKKTVAKAKPSR